MNRLYVTTGAFLMLVLAVPIAASRGSAGERKFYDCILEQVLPGGKDVLLMLGVEDGEVRQHALRIADVPELDYRLKSHRLKVQGNRLGGPLEIQVGIALEKIDLDVALDQGGTYSVSYGCPRPPRKVEGSVIVEAPKAASSKRWVLFLQDALRPETRLALILQIDREAKTLKAMNGWDSGYSQGMHPLDTTKLTFDGDTVEGEVAITLVGDPSTRYPNSLPPIDGLIRVKASLDAKDTDKAGNYSAVFGIEKRRRGQVSVKPGSEAALRELSAPLLSPQTPWRVWLATGPRIAKGPENQVTVHRNGTDDHEPLSAGNAQLSVLPPGSWSGRDFDDSLWGRYGEDLGNFVGGYGCAAVDMYRATSYPALLCLRTRFGVSDPDRVTDLRVSVEFLGGAVVYVNGVEVGRSRLPEGPITPHTPAADYPIAAYTVDDGQTPLPSVALGAKPEAKWLPHYQARVRTMTVSVPAKVLVRGGNVLAIELHRAPVCGPMQGGWSHVGVREVKLTSASGAGLVAYSDALRGTRVWSAQPVEQVADRLIPISRIPGGWSRGTGLRGLGVTGIATGNPFDPPVPLRILVPRNGMGAAQAVLSDPEGLQGVGASVRDFTGPAGAMLSAKSVRLWFAAQGQDTHWCDDLLKKPPTGVKTLPVWLEVQAPKDQRPGWYASTLALEANGKSFQVPVQVFVTGYAVPDAKNFRALITAMHSPDTMAKLYEVEPWSDAHFKLMERSLEMVGQLGGDVMFVPVIIGTHMKSGSGLIRWVKTDKGLHPDFSLFEKYLDLYQKHCAPPKAISLYVWSPESAKEVADVYENRQISTRSSNPKASVSVTVWDPRTRVSSDVVVPTFLDEGAEAFWKPMFDGVHAIVKRRGWSERSIMLGCGGDTRASERTGELLRKWAPYARWDIYSHFSGDPGAAYRGPPLPGWAPGKFIAVGNLEVGMREAPSGGCYSAAALEQFWLRKIDYLDLTMHRVTFYDRSGPMMFRTLPMHNGSLSRVGIDFWPVHGRAQYGVLIWGSYALALAGRGAEGPIPTVRMLMMRQGLQDFEARLTVVEALPKLPPERQKTYRELLDELPRRVAVGNAYLAQMELNLDWPAYVARVYRAAEELTGIKTDARWEQPPK